MQEKPKLDPNIFATLFASKGALLAVGGIVLLFAKPIITGGILVLIGHLSGKVIKRLELRRKISC